ncbi:nuclear receptor NHR-32 [Aphelenchoides avenae]|nr:nuclear receptor NHR-32 [Aphelenchus avenae]
MEEVIKMEDVDHLVQTPVEYCSVCGDQADGYHYGVLSCRGCNAFYRRATTYNLQFQCRRGGNCVIDKNTRCACRACRLKKCNVVGMDRTAVQPKRDAPGRPASRSAAGPSRGSGSECGSVADSNKSSPQAGESVVGSPASTGLTPLPGSVGSAASHPYASPMSFTYVSNGMPYCPRLLATTQSTCFLTRLVEDYYDQRRRRRSMLCTTLEEILCDESASFNSESHLKGAATPDDYSAIYRVQMILMFEWAEKLEEFKLIANPHDKARLLRAFSLKYLLLDNAFHTIELNYTDRLVLVNNTYIQAGNFPMFTGEESLEKQRALAMMYSDNSLRMIEELIQPMVEMNITYGEILALRLIIFWNPGSIGLSPQTTEIIHKASERTIKELHNWFDENKVSEVKTRLGNVLLLLSPIAKHTQYLTELTSMIPDFGAMPEWDSFMNDLLR